MKNIFSSLRTLVFLFLCTFSIVGCEPMDDPILPGTKVTLVNLTVDKNSFSGTCPHEYKFSAVITADGSGTVNYRWERSNGQMGTQQSVNFTTAGQATVTDAYKINATGTVGVRVRVLQPNEITSSVIDVTTICN